MLRLNGTISEAGASPTGDNQCSFYLYEFPRYLDVRESPACAPTGGTEFVKLRKLSRRMMLTKKVQCIVVSVVEEEVYS